MGNTWSTTPPTRKYGWKKPEVHTRQLRLLTAISAETMPPSVDLRSQFSFPVFDQGLLGSCVANATCAALGLAMTRAAIKDASIRSRLFVYFNARAIEGDIHTDTGTTIEAGVSAIKKSGACPEADWPYYINRFTQLPPKTCYDSGAVCKYIDSHQVSQNLIQLKQALINGSVICFGFMAFMSLESPETTKTGIVPMPDPAKEQCLGGHAIVLVGYQEDQKRFIFRNSWGIAWGDQGYGYMPYDYVLNPMLSGDFWIIDKLNPTPPAPPVAVTAPIPIKS
jgi:C1A family cysteine protease